MKKEEVIKRYGQAAYDRNVEQSGNWRLNNPEKVEEFSREQNRKGGKYYPKVLESNHTGLRGERNKVRRRDARMWQQYKRIIAPDSQLHHAWLVNSAGYDGLALVEADQHMHGIIDVIQVLNGEINIFTEKELRERGAS